MAKNKSYNKLIAGTMTAAMVAGVVAPVAASAEEKKFSDVPAGHWSEKAINEMAAKGIIAGQGDGTFGFGNNVTRAQVATFMVKAKEIKVDDNAKPSFTDVAENNMYKKFIAAAEANKIMSGIGGGNFGPDKELTRVEMAQILVNAYGFKADENNKKSFDDIKDLTWGTEAIETLASLEIVKGDGKNFNPHGVVTREQAAQFIYNAMNYKKPEAKVVSATPINGKEVEIKFGTEINIDTKDAAKKAVALELFTLNGAKATDIKVASDNKTVVVTFDNLHNITDAVLVVNPVETKADAKVKTAKHTQVITYKDTVRPAISGVEYVDANTAKVVFTEPVENLGEVSVNNDKAVVKTDEFKKGQNFVTVDLTNVAENAEVVVTVVGATDFAGNLISPNPAKATVKKQVIDKTKPVVSGVEALSDTQLKVTFSKEMSPQLTTADFDVNGAAPTKVELDKDNKKVVYVTTNLKDGVNKVTVKTTAKDQFGFALEKDYVKQLVVTVDTVAPQVSKYEVVTEKVEGTEKQFLVLTYNEDVTVEKNVPTTGTHVSNYVTKNDASFAGALDQAERTNKKVVKISLADVTPGTWTIKLGAGFVKDTAQTPNESKEQSVTFNVGEVKPEAKELNYKVEEANNVVTVKFNGEVDGASATNVANYTVEGAKVEKAVLTKNNATDGATVELTLKEGSVEASGNYAVAVTGVKDKSKTLEAKLEKNATSLVELTENVAPKVEKAELVNGKEIVLTFSESVDASTIEADAKDFVVLLDGTEVTKLTENPMSVSATPVADSKNKKFTLTLSRELASKEVSKTVTIKTAKAGFEIKDENGNKLGAIESLNVSKIFN
ncbi:S-layer homology domain-containing protein [Bacillus manliponensis]|uniref:S-layer homology domain-containing protein n=1 Tax=Bacillus manliponensis TaxID=574376 RepID=UPI0035174910